MILDISANQGTIDWKTVFNENEIERVILRATTKNGKLDTKFMENYNGILRNCNQELVLDVYKFAYALDFQSAFIEAAGCLQELNCKGVLNSINMFWLDLENVPKGQHTSAEAEAIIWAYKAASIMYNVKFGIYANYNYLKNIIPSRFYTFPIWAARYNSTLGDVSPFVPELWQYTCGGTVSGIDTAVDISRDLLK